MNVRLETAKSAQEEGREGGREKRRGKFCMRTRFPLPPLSTSREEERPLHKQVEKELLSGGGGQIRALLCLLSLCSAERQLREVGGYWKLDWWASIYDVRTGRGRGAERCTSGHIICFSKISLTITIDRWVERTGEFCLIDIYHTSLTEYSALISLSN